MELILIRHFQTKGNLEGRYIGVTDEPLLQSEEVHRLAAALRERLAGVEAVCASPLKRCVETAALLFPAITPVLYPGLRECDFGLFENKNYEELKGLPEYQRWLDSGGRIPFPQGEGRDAFCRRCCGAFHQAVEQLLQKGVGCGAVVFHGGGIMAALESIDPRKRDFYSWQVKNGGGYRLRLDEKEWLQNVPGQRTFESCEPLLIE